MENISMLSGIGKELSISENNKHKFQFDEQLKTKIVAISYIFQGTCIVYKDDSQFITP